jgi:3D (Asp-Asp-Asp) domain-containing protein
MKNILTTLLIVACLFFITACQDDPAPQSVMLYNQGGAGGPTPGGGTNNSDSSCQTNCSTGNTGTGGGGTGTGTGGGDDTPDPGTYLGAYKWTYYYITYESEFAGAQDTWLYDEDGIKLVLVRNAFAAKVSIEGTGYLLDGRMINMTGSCSYGTYKKCFFLVDMDQFPFGVGSNDNPLHPYRSVAADMGVLNYGQKLYVPALDGVEMPGEYGFVHDGCVIVEDVGGSVTGEHLDFFALSHANHDIIDAALGYVEEVDVYKDSEMCP